MDNENRATSSQPQNVNNNDEMIDYTNNNNTDPNTLTRTGHKTSPVWNYFTLVENKEKEVSVNVP